MKKHKPVAASNLPARQPYPAISVIIPMYNAEKYIGACLDSILAQTFTDFEVIVVDDCSTDSSCAIVESYREKFGGRLTLLHMAQNSGHGAPPRNKGLAISRGEYIYFMDADDAVTKTAFAELYALAKEFKADVVYCEKSFDMDDDGSNVRTVNHQQGKLVDNPTLQPDDLNQRVQYLLRQDIWGAPWSKLVRRNLLVENAIAFQNVNPCEDYLWTLVLFFYAKKFLHVPNTVYLWRQTKKSLSRGKKTPQQLVSLWLNSAILGLKGLDNMLGGLNFFRDNPQHRYDVINHFLNKILAFGFQMGLPLPPFAYYETIRQDFGSRLGEQDVLVAALCTLVNILQRANILNIQQFNKIIAQVQDQFNKFNQFAAQAQARVTQLEAELKRR